MMLSRRWGCWHASRAHFGLGAPLGHGGARSEGFQSEELGSENGCGKRLLRHGSRFQGFRMEDLGCERSDCEEAPETQSLGFEGFRMEGYGGWERV